MDGWMDGWMDKKIGDEWIVVLVSGQLEMDGIMNG